MQQSQMVQPAGGSGMGAVYPQGVQQAAAQQPGVQGQQQILLARPQLQQPTPHINRPRKCGLGGAKSLLPQCRANTSCALCRTASKYLIFPCGTQVYMWLFFF